MAREVMCQYSNCLESVGEQGVSVTLRSEARGAKKAVFCCASHAAASLHKLALDPPTVPTPHYWKSA